MRLALKIIGGSVALLIVMLAFIALVDMELDWWRGQFDAPHAKLPAPVGASDESRIQSLEVRLTRIEGVVTPYFGEDK